MRKYTIDYFNKDELSYLGYFLSDYYKLEIVLDDITRENTKNILIESLIPYIEFDRSSFSHMAFWKLGMENQILDLHDKNNRLYQIKVNDIRDVYSRNNSMHIVRNDDCYYRRFNEADIDKIILHIKSKNDNELNEKYKHILNKEYIEFNNDDIKYLFELKY